MQSAKDNKSQENTAMSLQEAIAQLSVTSKTYPDEAVKSWTYWGSYTWMENGAGKCFRIS